MKAWILGTFGIVALLQLALPASQIWQHERILRDGEALKFRIKPVDPPDRFRGRYVWLELTNRRAPKPQGLELSRHEHVVVLLSLDADGFAVPASVQLDTPTTGRYVYAHVAWAGPDYVHLALPFERFYMNERLAPEAERRFRELRGTTRPSWLSVRVLDGKTVAEELYIEGEPVR